MMCKVSVNAKSRSEIVDIAETLQAEIVDVGLKSMTLLLVGNQTKVKAFLELLKPYGFKEIVRTGRIATTRDSGQGEKN